MDNRIRLIKYAIINGLLTGAYFLLYYILIECFGMKYVVANVISYIITIIAAYYMTKVYVFESIQNVKKEIGYFLVIRIAMVGISTIGLWATVNILEMGKYISFFSVNMCCFLVSYLLNKKVFMGDRMDET